jgi:hypothetical protein
LVYSSASVAFHKILFRGYQKRNPKKMFWSLNVMHKMQGCSL